MQCSWTSAPFTWSGTCVQIGTYNEVQKRLFFEPEHIGDGYVQCHTLQKLENRTYYIRFHESDF